MGNVPFQENYYNSFDLDSQIFNPLNTENNEDINLNGINISYSSNENINNNETNKYIGRKKQKNDTNEESYIPDKYIKKTRIMILNSIITFINQQIILFTTKRKRFLSINKKDLSHSSVEYDKEFLEKKLKEILSSISKKYTNYLDTENKKLIEYLINLEDKGKYFQELFELSFLDCIEHINGTKTSELLNGLPTMEEMFKNEMKKLNGFDIDKLKNCFMKYEQKVINKKPRKSKKAKKNNIYWTIKK